MNAFGQAALMLALASPGLADGVTLSANTGGLVIEGELLGYDGRFFRIETPDGEVTVDGQGVTCRGSACPDPEKFVPELRIATAASVMDRTLPALIETFARREGLGISRQPHEGRGVVFELNAGEAPAARLVLRASTSSEAFADLIADEADLAISLRDVTRAEADLARQAGRGDPAEPGRSRILALDGLVPVVSVSNPLKRLSMGDLRRIIAGEIADWSEIDAAMAGPVALHLPAITSGLTEALRRRVLGPGSAVPARTATFHDTGLSLDDAVAGDPLALGIAAFSDLGNAQAVDLEGQCGAISRADEESLKTEDYPLTAPIFLYSPMRRLAPLPRAFVEYITSPAAQPVIDRTGYVDQFPRVIPISGQGDRLANAIRLAGPDVSLADLQRMMERLAGKARLSISFRFENGSSILDAQSRSNVSLLAKGLDRGVFFGRTLLFAGFSDGQGPALTNRRLSETRAIAVRDAVRAAASSLGPDSTRLEVAAFGEIMPMACDEAAWGRQVNRRVEVWLQ